MNKNGSTRRSRASCFAFKGLSAMLINFRKDQMHIRSYLVLLDLPLFLFLPMVQNNTSTTSTSSPTTTTPSRAFLGNFPLSVA